MGQKTSYKLIFRSIILAIGILLTLINPSIIVDICNFKIVGGLRIYHIFWAFLMFEMLVVLFPKYNKYSYCGKHLGRHYVPAKYSKEKLKEYTRKNYWAAFRALVFWVLLNGIIGFIYVRYNLNPGFMYLLFIFYYWSDMFCVNVWCPFHKIIVGNKCCNECRIYNWGHIMYFTPLLFVPNFWTYSLFFMSLLIWIQWEYQYFCYPERFSPLSNRTLRCSDCENECRFNKTKYAKQ